MTNAERLLQANAAAQSAFARMLNTGTYADPNAPETRAYVEAERTLDHLLLDAQQGRLTAEWDELAAGDHFARPAA